MAWESAMVLSLLGTAFFLVYVASLISSEHWFQKFLKLFLVLVSFTFIIQVTGIPSFLLDADQHINSTTTCTNALTNDTVCTTITTMNQTAFNELKDNMGAALHSSTIIFRLLMFAAIFGFIIYIMEELWNLHKKRRGLN